MLSFPVKNYLEIKLYKEADKITLDFETRSKTDLPAVGTWNYSVHESTEVMCLAWQFRGEKGFWHCAHPHMIAKLTTAIDKAERLKDRAKKAERKAHYQNLINQYREDIQVLQETAPPTRLFELIADGHPVEAHNVFFEHCIWDNICVKRMGWPAVNDSQWRCSAAKASMHALPRDLERATLEMCPDNCKDTEGKRVMMKLCKPAKPTKADPDKVWHEDPEDLRTLWDYCIQDVSSEHSLSESLDDLPPYELALWQMDQRMNLRGFYCDHDLAHRAIDFSKSLTDQLNAQLEGLTHGELEKASQRKKIKEWLENEIYPENLEVDEEGEPLHERKEIEGTGAPVLDRLILDPTVEGTTAHAVIDIVRAVNRTSIKKYQAMLDRSDADDQRIRDMMMYHGAGTGRWSGKGVQPHNFPRGAIKDMEGQCRELLECSLEELQSFLEYSPKELMSILSGTLRGGLCAPPGRQLYVADYSSIEARVLVWLANDQSALDVFFAGKDIYKDMSCAIYNVAYGKVTDEQRRMGKQAILGLGYQMGAPKFWDTIAGYEPTYKGVGLNGDELDFTCLEGSDILAALKRAAKGNDAILDALKYGSALSFENKIFLLRRIKDPLMRQNADRFFFVRDVVIKYREKYHSVKSMWREQNNAAIAAVDEPGTSHTANKVTWKMNDNNFLTCELPSGRKLYYRNPELGTNQFGNKSLYYWSVDAVTKQWRRTGTYGGKLVENITQAIARDLMADAMLRIDDHEVYDLLASVHDELICEADEGTGDVEEFETLMAEIQPWATGCPVAAEGWAGMRYRK